MRFFFTNSTHKLVIVSLKTLAIYDDFKHSETYYNIIVKNIIRDSIKINDRFWKCNVADACIYANSVQNWLVNNIFVFYPCDQFYKPGLKHQLFFAQQAWWLFLTKFGDFEGWKKDVQPLRQRENFVKLKSPWSTHSPTVVKKYTIRDTVLEGKEGSSSPSLDVDAATT